MPLPENFPNPSHPQVVGSFGNAESLKTVDFSTLATACDLVEIRLDILKKEISSPDRSLWEHLQGVPILFTARRNEEGGALPLDAAARMELLKLCLMDAAIIDIEVASISEMAAMIPVLREWEIPWMASFHDFEKLPSRSTLDEAAQKAKNAGATIFKVAAKLSDPEELAALADFQLTDHGLAVSSMGMGPLAPVSRQLLAQCGSVLNYGYLGNVATAPGQWDSALLKTAVSRLVPFNR